MPPRIIPISDFKPAPDFAASLTAAPDTTASVDNSTDYNREFDAIGNRGLEGLAGIADMIGVGTAKMAAPDALLKMLGVENPLHPENANFGTQGLDYLKSQGLYDPTNQPQTTLGAIAGEGMAYAPAMLMGGEPLPTIAAGLTAGGAKAMGAPPWAQLLSALTIPSALEGGYNWATAESPLTRAEQKLSARIPAGDIPDAQTALSSAISENSPMMLPEALDSPSLANNMRFLGQYEPSTNIVQDALQSRAGDRYNRVNDILDTLSTQRSPYDAGSGLSKAVSNSLEPLQTARRTIADEQFGKVAKETPTFDSPQLKGYLNNGFVQQAINKVRKDFPILKGLPDNSTEVLDQTRQYMNDMAAQSAPYRAGLISEARNHLTELMTKENKGYRSALDSYALNSSPINTIEESALGKVAGLTPINQNTAGDVLMRYPPEQISQAADLLQNPGAIRGAARGALQSTLDKNGGNVEFLMGDSGLPLRQKLVAALQGDTSSEDLLISKLGREKLYNDFNRKYAGNSATSNYFNEQAMHEGVGLKDLASPQRFLLDTLLEKASNKWNAARYGPSAKEIAQIMTDPKKSKEFLDKILPILLEKPAPRNFIQTNTIPIAATGASSHRGK